MTRLTFGGGYGNPLWTATAATSYSGRHKGMLWTRADGTGQAQPLTRATVSKFHGPLQPMGSGLHCVNPIRHAASAIWTVPVDSAGSGLRAGKPESSCKPHFGVRSPMFSPDGRLAHVHVQRIRPLPGIRASVPDKMASGKSRATAVLSAWVAEPARGVFWSHGQLMVASSHERQDSFVADKPRVWTEKEPAPLVRRGAMIRRRTATPRSRSCRLNGPRSSRRVIFLLNFFDEWRRRAPMSSN